MANAKLISVNTSKTYVIKGFTRVQERIGQVVQPLPIPLTQRTSAVLAPLVGQSSNLIIEFILVFRDDDYTDGTSVPPGSAPYSPVTQRAYLVDTIFTATGKHRFTDETGQSFDGRIIDFEYVRQGDDPNSDSVVINFAIGSVIG